MALAALIAVGLIACGNDDDSEATSVSEAPASEAPADEMDATEDAASALETSGDIDVTLSDRPATGGATTTGAPIDQNFGRDLVIDAGIVIVTSDVRAAVDDIMRISRRNGGAIFNTDVVIEDPRDDGSVPGGGSIVVRLPPAQLDLLIGDLSGVGTIRNQTQTVDDVTDRVTDLEVQIEQARISVDRMQALLAEATDFDGLVAAERELVNRQTAYERLLAAQRNLDDRIALSTLTVMLEYAAPDQIEATVADDDPGIADAFSDGWNAFVGLLFGVAFVLAVAAPFLAVGLVVVGVGLLTTRRLRARTATVRSRHEPLDPPEPSASLPTPTRDDAETDDPVAQTSDAGRG